MEKIVYQSPEMEVVEMKSEGFLCASDGESGGGGAGGFAPKLEFDEEDILFDKEK